MVVVVVRAVSIKLWQETEIKSYALSYRSKFSAQAWPSDSQCAS